MIKSFSVKNYKALRDLTVELTPIHVLIGPNDAGKTSFLEAVAALSNSVDRELIHGFPGRWKGRDLVWQHQAENRVVFQVELQADAGCLWYQLGLSFSPAPERVVRTVPREDPFVEQIRVNGEAIFANRTTGPVSWVCGLHASPNAEQTPATKRVFEGLSGFQSYRWLPQHLSLPVAPTNQPPFQLWPSGFGLVHCLDDILSSDRERFAELERRFVDYFHNEITKIILKRETACAGRPDDFGELSLSESPGKGLYFGLKGGTVIPASQVSDGVLIVLAYLTILHVPRPPRILMVDEPENGIHPQRLEDVVKILRELVETQKHTQVILTTHSPYLLDRFSKEEVTLFKKNSDGAVTAHQLSKSKAVREQIDVFNLGEIWAAEGEERLAENIDPSEAKRS